MVKLNRQALAAGLFALLGFIPMTVTADVPDAPKNFRLGGSATPSPTPVPTATPAPTATPVPSGCSSPASGKTAHAYFDTLKALPQCIKAVGFRSNAELQAHTFKPSTPNSEITYNPASDTYPDKQDAAKMVLPTGGGFSLKAGDMLYIGPPSGYTRDGSHLYTWDFYWGEEFRTHRPVELRNFKSFQFMPSGDKGWWTHSTTFRLRSSTDLREVGKANDSIRMQGPYAVGVVDREPLKNTGPGAVPQWASTADMYPIHHSKWTRYWVEIRLKQPPSAFKEWADTYNGGVEIPPNAHDAAGHWWMISMWAADEQRNPTRLLYKVPIDYSYGGNWDARLSKMRVEMNTSQSGAFTVPMVGYLRNFVILHNYPLPTVPENDTALFKRPVR